MSNCPKCGNPVQEETEFCPICGTRKNGNMGECDTRNIDKKKEQQEEPRPIVPTWTCHICGSLIEESLSSCPDCGARKKINN